VLACWLRRSGQEQEPRKLEEQDGERFAWSVS